MSRYGVTIPYDRTPLCEQRELIEEIHALGYSDVWSAEASATDGFVPLAMATAWVPELRLGTAIVPSFTRGPATLAMCVATLAEAAPARFQFGLGSSSDVIVERWNGIPFAEPYKRNRDMVRFLKAALAGEKVTEDYDTFSVKGFRLERPPAVVPPILVAALRPGMLRLAGRLGDGTIINWLSAEDVKRIVPEVGAGKEVVARIYVCPTEDAVAVRSAAKVLIAAYLNVEVYRLFQQWLGRGPQLQAMWDLWRAGDRKGAVEAIPDAVVDDLVVHGTPAECRAHVERYVANGVTVPVLMPLPFGVSSREAVRLLAPSAVSTPA
ncbi:MAG TPA: LLM class F420-dependent oxidoreductase [Acidimicrobiales bacterium]|nr:LLM class F420-dependent oxidoreductase [Acidimicrobiales bacterium]